MRGGQSQQNGSGLCHVERIKGSGKRNAQHVRATLGNAWAQAFVFVAQHQNGGQAHGLGKGVKAAGTGLASGTVDGQPGFFGAVQGVAKVGHAGYGQMLKGACGGAPRRAPTGGAA